MLINNKDDFLLINFKPDLQNPHFNFNQRALCLNEKNTDYPHFNLNEIAHFADDNYTDNFGTENYDTMYNQYKTQDNFF